MASAGSSGRVVMVDITQRGRAMNLIDGDILPYKCGFATQETTYETVDGEVHATPTAAKKHILNMTKIGTPLPDDTVTSCVEAEPLSHALKLVKNLLLRVETRTGIKARRIFLTGDTNYRTEAATIAPYKGNRTQPKPLHWKAIRRYLIDKCDAEITDGNEADDALGIYQTDDTIICTIDKDLDMVPGTHYNWDKDIIYDVSPEQGVYNFYHQLLTGDSTDNIPGIPGIGAKRADLILNGLGSEEEFYLAALEAYGKKYDHPFEALLENAWLLWIQREPNELWYPPILRKTL